MPFALILIGALLIVAGIRNKLSDLGTLLAGDFSGPGNFFYWVAGIGALGAIGYYNPLRNVSRLFLALIILSMLLSDQGFFEQLKQALQSVQAPAKASETDVGQATSDQSKGASGGASQASTSIPGLDLGTAATDALNTVIPGAGTLADAIGVDNIIDDVGGSLLSGAGDLLGGLF